MRSKKIVIASPGNCQKIIMRKIFVYEAERNVTENEHGLDKYMYTCSYAFTIYTYQECTSTI